jgi:hypothetical protein
MLLATETAVAEKSAEARPVYHRGCFACEAAFYDMQR